MFLCYQLFVIELDFKLEKGRVVLYLLYPSIYPIIYGNKVETLSEQ